jgi:uncharacterized membrane protein HdeD (DUF308 family)
MSGSMDATADQTHAMMQDLADHWGLAVVMGIVSVILGLLAMFYPGATIVTIAIFFAAWLFVSGFFEVITSFTRDGDTGSRVLHAIIGVLSVIVGFALLRTPFQSVEVFIFVLGIFWLVQGIMSFVAAFAQKEGRNWRIVMGLLGILAGSEESIAAFRQRLLSALGINGQVIVDVIPQVELVIGRQPPRGMPRHPPDRAGWWSSCPRGTSRSRAVRDGSRCSW